METIKAAIITIGDELLIGQVIDTNSAWMAQELNKAGIMVQQRTAVGDNAEDIVQALDESINKAQIVLITGGLGPTSDDITKPVLARYFGEKMTINEAALQNVKNIFIRLGNPLSEVNIKQAELPEGCKAIQNLHGTAPGMWFEKSGKIIVSMPGVPHEMKNMMTNDVLPMLKAQFTLPTVVHKTLLTAGIGESQLAEHIKDWELQLPANIKLAYLPNARMVRLRLTTVVQHDATTSAELQIQYYFDTLQQLVQEWLITNRDEPIALVLGNLLKKYGRTMATAESCTGGYIAHLITSMEGSSAYYLGSIVSYANQVKQDELHVPAEILQQHGAVSKPVAEQMVRGALQNLKTNYAVAVTGIMGPDGGSAEKPVGTVWMAVGNNNNIATQKIQLRFDRKQNIEVTATYALNFLRSFILENEQPSSN